MVEKKSAAAGYFESLRVGQATREEGLTVFPLLGGPASGLDFLVLGEALSAGVLEVTEKPGATVPEILVVNNGKKDVFIMDGEELAGAKQNRVVNISLVVPAGGRVEIPVSCVEAGRWHDISRKFSDSGNVSFAGLRRAQKETVLRSMESSGSFASDQSMVWEQIDRKAARHGVRSQTGAMRDIYRDSEKSLSEKEKKFAPAPGQVGALFAVGGEIFGLDAFDREDTWRKLAPKIIRSYLLEALGVEKAAAAPGEEAARELLARAAASTAVDSPSPGAGTILRLSGEKVSGTLLLSGETVAHAAVFNLPEEAGPGGSGPVYRETTPPLRRPGSRRDNLPRGR